MRERLAQVRRLLDTVPPVIFTLLVLSVVGMNLLANKSVNTGVEWLALDCGILLSWLCFLSMDVLTHCFGPRAATAASMVALALNLLMAAIFVVASRVPGVWGESFVETGGEAINLALDNTFGGTWFVILGSSIAFAVSAVYISWFISNFIRRLSSRTLYSICALPRYFWFYEWYWDYYYITPNLSFYRIHFTGKSMGHYYAIA